MPTLPLAVSERLGRRANLPPLQVYVGLASWCAKIIAAMELPENGSPNLNSCSKIQKQ